jgi:uncharacterized protein (DUF2147 family)
MLSTTASATPAAPALEGFWRFVDDGTVVEFARCQEAFCATVRALPMQGERTADDPKCAQKLIGDMKPDGTKGHYLGWVIDPSDNKRYIARLEPESDQRLRLVIRAMGGLISETYTLQAAKEPAAPCRP